MQLPHAPILASAVVLLSTLTACVDVDSCEDYVDYMCNCHSEDVDCETIRSTYQGAGSELQDECSLALDDQEILDFEDGYVCSDGTDTDPPS